MEPTNDTSHAIDPFAASWHRESYDRFLERALPAQLAERLPLVDYRVTPAHERRETAVVIAVNIHGDVVHAEYSGLPGCDAHGIFHCPAFTGSVTGKRRIVVPVASCEDLSAASIRCAGDLLEAAMAERLALVAPVDDLKDEICRVGGLRKAVPIDEWIVEFFERHGQHVDATNWLATQVHLRRIRVEGDIIGFHPGQVGRVCFIETPEGPNVGRYLSIARGARIEDGHILPASEPDDSAYLGITAACIPAMEHTSDARLLMGANMMRQWMPLSVPEAALVQTGHEPPVEDAPDFWCGRNLLTAFISWGVDTHEDAVVLSRSAAARFASPAPLTVGDRLTHRHGAKGVVSRILPDEEMPHLPDGTAIEIIYGVASLPSRLNHGQVVEAVLGRLAVAEGRPVIAPPFAGPDVAEMQGRLVAAGLDPSGMEQLTNGKGGAPFDHPSTVGYVYWGKNAPHTVPSPMAMGDGVTPTDGLSQNERTAIREGQILDPADYAMLLRSGAVHTIHALYTLQAQTDGHAGTDRLAALVDRLATIGVALNLDENGLVAALSAPPHGVTLAERVPYPGVPTASMTAIAGSDAAPTFRSVQSANERLASLHSIADGLVPETLYQPAIAALRRAVSEYVTKQVSPTCLRMVERVCYSGRAMAAPGDRNQRIEQVGLSDEMAWILFGPLLAQRRLADPAAVQERSNAAVSALDTLMNDCHVLVSGSVSIGEARMLALRPFRLPVGEHVVRIHPFHCALLDADFDGDHIVVYLPTSMDAQSEMAEKLTPLAQVTRNRALIGGLSLHSALYGIASHSMTPGGRAEWNDMIGSVQRFPSSFCTKSMVADGLALLYDQSGPAAALTAIERIYQRGFEVAKQSGASFPPFPAVPDLPTAPPNAARDDDWDSWRDAVADILCARSAAGRFDNDGFGPILLYAASGARGTWRALARYVACTGSVDGSHSFPGPGKYVFFGVKDVVRHSLRDGLTREEAISLMAGYRRSLKRAMLDYRIDVGDGIRGAAYDLAAPANPDATGLHFMARALRSPDPVSVFARAAITGETDPLTDVDSRLFVGLPPI
jgi:hypothetical protein